MPKLADCPNSEQYDYIVVGSGNGACAFLHQYLACSTQGNVLVIEEGENFFETSDISHQRNWTQSYSEANIFKLHNAQTPDGTPILSGRACTMGGGGSINYTMIFESSQWLSEHLGHDPDYWTDRKAELSQAFERTDPNRTLTPAAEYVKAKLEAQQFTINKDNSGHIPVYPDDQDKQIHIFPTQFNEFGQRTHSGISLLHWSDNPRLDYVTQRKVTHLQLEAADDEDLRCSAITIENLETGDLKTHLLGNHTKLLLCAGAATPQLLYEHRDRLQNLEIGEHVNDHILLPFGIYLLPKPLQVSLKDQYLSLFATTEVRLGEDEAEEPTVCNFDFFSGQLDVLIYLISHLFLAFWVPNWLKVLMIGNPRVFQQLKDVSRWLIARLNGLDDLLWSLRHPTQMGQHQWNLISAIVKFNIVREGFYQPSDGKTDPPSDKSKLYEVILRCFQASPLQDDPDYRIARTALINQIPLVESLGAKPHPFFQFLIRLFTRMPYSKLQVDDYIQHYSRNDLLTEQHLSGGCVFGKALNRGEESAHDTGKVIGSQNIYVADLSAAPLPRVSPQMTAYLIGHHVATQHCQRV
ncbi:Oxygen-dependent choline dehydrogenase [Acaryochloris thomasi RCC1774]|uniref:Oxygen-dependent choline dehydrogenase n=1 Tax=Acaryochloris thomasi RCC1774 TaxID=1764569 RepID=A0A2W1J7U3_9CYAN|nr:GMC oxidoreductase [Acaryochloris thomasi]PZD70288.1 Oxygen-dependent choline dehydrogenase [Acaryochloris thomasi RCC1774]